MGFSFTGDLFIHLCESQQLRGGRPNPQVAACDMSHLCFFFLWFIAKFANSWIHEWKFRQSCTKSKMVCPKLINEKILWWLSGFIWKVKNFILFQWRSIFFTRVCFSASFVYSYHVDHREHQFVTRMHLRAKLTPWCWWNYSRIIYGCIMND